jgi:hypothetical protein
MEKTVVRFVQTIPSHYNVTIQLKNGNSYSIVTADLQIINKLNSENDDEVKDAKYILSEMVLIENGIEFDEIEISL